MTDKTMFDGLRDVKGENIASDAYYEPAIRNAIEQGKGGWGVNRMDAVILRLALEVERTASAAELAAGFSAELTGKRLELGRTKAAKTRADAMLTQEQAVSAGLKIAMANLTGKLQSLRDVANENLEAARKHQARADDVTLTSTAAIATLTKQLATVEAEVAGLRNGA